MRIYLTNCESTVEVRVCTSVRDVLKWERKKLKELGREQSEKQRPVLGCAV